MKKYVEIISVALWCVIGSSCFAQDALTEEQKVAYGNVLWQFWDAVRANGTYEHLIGESPVNYIFLRYPLMEDSQLAFSITDLNEDGSMELMIGYQDTASIVNLFSYKDGKLVQLLEAAEERWYTTMCANGLLDYEGSGGAAHHRSAYYSVGEDGKSLITEEDYYIDGEEHYVEDIEGNDIPFNGEYDQYVEKYESQMPKWIPLTYEKICEATVPYEIAGERLTIFDIPAAPQFKNGICVNGTEVFIRYKKATVAREISESWICRDDYEHWGDEIQTYQIKHTQTDQLISTAVVNLRTGDVEETDAWSGEVKKFNMFEFKTESIEENDGTYVAESYDSYASLVSHYESLYGEVGQTVLFEWMDCLTGVCTLDLIDFNRDGTEELLLVYGIENDYGSISYQYEVWGKAEDGIVKLNAGKVSASGDGYNYLRIISHDGNEYLLEEEGAIESWKYYYGYIGNEFSLVRECNSYWDSASNMQVYFIDGVPVSFEEMLRAEEAWKDSERIYGFTIKNLGDSIASVEETKRKL